MDPLFSDFDYSAPVSAAGTTASIHIKALNSACPKRLYFSNRKAYETLWPVENFVKNFGLSEVSLNILRKGALEGTHSLCGTFEIKLDNPTLVWLSNGTTAPSIPPSAVGVS